MGEFLSRLSSRSRLTWIIALIVFVAGAGVGGYLIYKRRISADAVFSKTIIIAVNNAITDQAAINKYYSFKIGNFKCEEISVNINNIPTVNQSKSNLDLLKLYYPKIGDSISSSNSSKVHAIKEADFISLINSCYSESQRGQSTDLENCKSALQKEFIVNNLKLACDGSGSASSDTASGTYVPPPPPPPP